MTTAPTVPELADDAQRGSHSVQRLVTRPFVRVERGDSRTVLPTLEAKSVQCCVTSPPYWGLRDYGHPDQIGQEATPQEYIANLVTVFREVRRVLRDDGTLWLNLGDTYTGKSVAGMPWRVALALQADGWLLRQDIIWHKPNPMPESVTDRCTKAHEYLFLLTKAERYYFDAAAIAEPATCDRMRGPAKHADTKSTNGNDGLCRRPIAETRNKRSVWSIVTESYKGAHFAPFPRALVAPCILAGTSAAGCCPDCSAPWKNGEPSCTCTPERDYYTPIPCCVLDPFGGSGTTGVVALEHGRSALLIELSEEYERLINQRLTTTPGLPLAG